MIQTDNFKQVQIDSSPELRKWLLKNHRQDSSVWLVTFKKHIEKKYVSTGEVLDELLCFGWIDGIRRKLDDDRTMQLISPRKTQHWAKTYKVRAAKLTKEGRMHESGLASVAQSKRNGLWTFMDDVDALIVPPDFATALASTKHAAKHFDACGDSYKRNILRWIKLAKSDATRQKRIQQASEFAQRNERIAQM